MRWPWIREARLIEPRSVVNPKVLELQTAKEILAEVFHVPPGEVAEMIQRRLEESRPEEERQEELWPREFCLDRPGSLLVIYYVGT